MNIHKKRLGSNTIQNRTKSISNKPPIYEGPCSTFEAHKRNWRATYIIDKTFGEIYPEENSLQDLEKEYCRLKLKITLDGLSDVEKLKLEYIIIQTVTQQIFGNSS